MRKLWKPLGGLVIGCLLGWGGYAVLDGLRNPLEGTPEISWALMAQAETDFVPEILAKAMSQELKLGGFVVPLSDNFQEIREFLLVPDPMSCIHAPPPPSNQMVLVQLEKPMNPQLAYGPVWVKGNLSLKSYRTEFGEVSYSMRASFVTLYQDNPWK